MALVGRGRRPCRAPTAAAFWVAGARILTTSSSVSGDGREVAPTNPVTPGRVADRAPRLVVEIHPDQDVAREDLALHLLALAVLDLDDLFGRHLDLEDVVLHVQGLDAALEVGLHLVLVAGVGVHDVPVAELGAQLACAAPRPGPRPRRRLAGSSARLVGLGRRRASRLGQLLARSRAPSTSRSPSSAASPSAAVSSALVQPSGGGQVGRTVGADSAALAGGRAVEAPRRRRAPTAGRAPPSSAADGVELGHSRLLPAQSHRLGSVVVGGGSSATAQPNTSSTSLANPTSSPATIATMITTNTMTTPV